MISISSGADWFWCSFPDIFARCSGSSVLRRKVRLVFKITVIGVVVDVEHSAKDLDAMLPRTSFLCGVKIAMAF